MKSDTRNRYIHVPETYHPVLWPLILSVLQVTMYIMYIIMLYSNIINVYIINAVHFLVDHVYYVTYMLETSTLSQPYIQYTHNIP